MELAHLHSTHSRCTRQIARLLAEFPKEIEDVADLKLLREQEGFGMKSFKKVSSHCSLLGCSIT